MQVVSFIFWTIYLLNSLPSVFAQSSSGLRSQSIWNMAKQIQGAKASVVRIHGFYSEGESQKSRRAGTGFIYNEQGFLVTRDNCVEGADSIVVFLSDGRESPAWIVYCDRSTKSRCTRRRRARVSCPSGPLQSPVRSSTRSIWRRCARSCTSAMA